MPKSDFFTLHDFGGFLIAGVVLVHIGAALMHGFVLRGCVSARMLPNGLMALQQVSRGK
jgi:cytochrome b561